MNMPIYNAFKADLVEKESSLEEQIAANIKQMAANTKALAEIKATLHSFSWALSFIMFMEFIILLKVFWG